MSDTNHTIYICPICNTKSIYELNCEHKPIIMNCTQEEYNKMKKSQEIKDRINNK